MTVGLTAAVVYRLVTSYRSREWSLLIWNRSTKRIRADVPLQRTVTLLASVEELELFLLDPPRLAGYELGRDLEIEFQFQPVLNGTSTELQGRLLRAPENFDRQSADRALRDVLRSIKQLIETGEVATVDARVHGRRVRQPRLGLLRGALS